MRGVCAYPGLRAFPHACALPPLQASSELQEMFGLSPEENLVEQFKCKLLQTYGCNHNNFTPAIQVNRTMLPMPTCLGL